MVQKSIRFGICDKNGNRAATWKLWTETSSGKSDVYLVCRKLGGAIKVSLHESGFWHLAYTEKTYEKQVKGTINKLKDRYIEKWQRPPEIAPGVTLSFRIVTPYSATTIPFGERNHKNVVWIPNAPEAQATEIIILFTQPTISVTGWPGKRASGTSLIGSIPLENGEIVWAVYQVVDMPDLSMVSNGVGRFYKGKSKEDLNSDFLRAHVFGKIHDDSRIIYDCAVE